MGSMPVAGSMSRSALNHTTGVHTTFSSIFTSKFPNIKSRGLHTVNFYKNIFFFFSYIGHAVVVVFDTTSPLHTQV